MDNCYRCQGYVSVTLNFSSPSWCKYQNMPLTDFGEIIPEWCPRREEELESEEGSPEQSQEVQDEYKAINLTRIKQGLSLVSLSLAASSATLYSFPEVPESPQHKALRQKRKQLKKNKKRGRR